MDESLRARLHERLDEILDLRAAIEPEPFLGGLLGALSTPAVPLDEARAVLGATVFLARDAAGDAIRRAAFSRTYLKETEHRSLLKSWLMDLWPLLDAPPFSVMAIAPLSELTVFDAIESLSALDAGEIRPIFKANSGKNRRANRWSLARTKVEALVWKRRLVALGYAEKAASFEVTSAFKEQWDTIRKWKAQCDQILGPEYVRRQLEFAEAATDRYVHPRSSPSGMFAATKIDPLKELASAASAYRRQLGRSAELSKRKNCSSDE